MTYKTILLGFAAAAIIAAPASAGGNAQSGPTVGDCISDGFYGNEPNIEPYAPGGPAEQAPGSKGGHVVPSQSPGPVVNNPADPDNPFPGPSVGDIHQLYGPGALPEYCRAVTDL
jgi:hypothetical protein